MPNRIAKAGRLLRATVLVGLIAISGANLWGADKCAMFQATIQGGFRVAPARGWYAEGYITAGDTVLRATMFWAAASVVPEKFNPNVFMGNEKAVFTVDGLGTFELVSHFVSPHRTFKEGVAMLNESGTIGNGTGIFVNVSGHFTEHGVYGPAVPGGVPPANLGFQGSMNGNICGVNLSGVGLTPTSN